MKKFLMIFSALFCLFLCVSCDLNDATDNEDDYISYVITLHVNDLEGKVNVKSSFLGKKGYKVNLDTHIPTIDGYEFEGWYSDSEHKTKLLDANIVVKEDITYYGLVSLLEKEDGSTGDVNLPTEDDGNKTTQIYIVTKTIQAGEVVDDTLIANKLKKVEFPKVAVDEIERNGGSIVTSTAQISSLVAISTIPVGQPLTEELFKSVVSDNPTVDDNNSNTNTGDEFVPETFETSDRIIEFLYDEKYAGRVFFKENTYYKSTLESIYKLYFFNNYILDEDGELELEEDIFNAPYNAFISSATALNTKIENISKDCYKVEVNEVINSENKITIYKLDFKNNTLTIIDTQYEKIEPVDSNAAELAALKLAIKNYEDNLNKPTEDDNTTINPENPSDNNDNTNNNGWGNGDSGESNGDNVSDGNGNGWGNEGSSSSESTGTSDSNNGSSNGTTDDNTSNDTNTDVNDKEDEEIEKNYLVQSIPVSNPNIFEDAYYQGYVNYDSTDMSSIEPFSDYEYYDGKTDGILLFPLAECIIGDRGYNTASAVTIRIYTQNIYTDVENLFLLVHGVEGSITIYGETEDSNYTQNVRRQDNYIIEVGKHVNGLGMIVITTDDYSQTLGKDYTYSLLEESYIRAFISEESSDTGYNEYLVAEKQEEDVTSTYQLNNVVSSVDEGLQTGKDFYILENKTVNNTSDKQTVISYPMFVFLKVYNEKEGFTYWAAPLAAFDKENFNIQAYRTEQKLKRKDSVTADGDYYLVNDNQGINYKIWIKITESHYLNNTCSYAPVYTQYIPDCAEPSVIAHLSALTLTVIGAFNGCTPVEVTTNIMNYVYDYKVVENKRYEDFEDYSTNVITQNGKELMFNFNPKSENCEILGDSNTDANGLTVANFTDYKTYHNERLKVVETNTYSYKHYVVRKDYLQTNDGVVRECGLSEIGNNKVYYSGKFYINETPSK